jgi:NADP-dependent 3-hydroxy acid dehydrogenase YdfG
MGLEVARLLSSQGGKVSIADIQEKALEDAKAEIEGKNGSCLVVRTDVREQTQVVSSPYLESRHLLDGCQ